MNEEMDGKENPLVRRRRWASRRAIESLELAAQNDFVTCCSTVPKTPVARMKHLQPHNQMTEL